MKLTATEAQTQQAILDLLTVEGIFAFRINTAAFAITGDSGTRRFFKAHSLGKGAADIRADVVRENVFNGVDVRSFVPLWLEVKSATGKQSPEQRSFQEFVERHGHIYALVRSVDDVLDVLWRIRKGGNTNGTNRSRQQHHLAPGL